MSRQKFVAEFEINASRKMLFPYLSTPSGLAQWFADDVNIDEDKVYHIIWDDENHKARMVSQRSNNHVKFEFIEDDDDEAYDDEEEPASVELRLEKNEMTQTTFLRIIDTSEAAEDEEEFMDMWESMVNTLKETVGG